MFGWKGDITLSDKKSSFLKKEYKDKEVWKRIKGEYYSVSNMGRIRSEARSRHRVVLPRKLLNPGLGRENLGVMLRNRDKKRSALVRDLVGNHFVPPFGLGKLIFRDGNNLNCMASNLKRIKTGIKGKLTEESKRAILEDETSSIKELAFEYAVSTTTIRNIKMTAQSWEIQNWVHRGKITGAAYVIIAVDRYDHDNYPIYVMPEDDFFSKWPDVNNMQGVDEVYDMSINIQEQLKEHRAWHTPKKEKKDEMDNSQTK